MIKKKSKLETLTDEEIEEITQKSEMRKDVPLIKSSQINIRVFSDLLLKAKKLAESQNMPYTTFLGKLLKEDIDRLWAVYSR